MGGKPNYTLVGLFVLLLSVAMLVTFVWLSSLHKGYETKYYWVFVEESVAGLVPKAQVTFNGVKVGVVDSMKINPNDPQEVELLLSINADTPINQATVASLRSQGITGATYVGLHATQAKAPALAVKPGMKYPIIPSEPSFLETVTDALKDATHNIARLSESVEKVVDNKNRAAIAASLQNVQKITATLAKNAKNLDRLLDSSAQVSEHLAAASQDLPATMTAFNQTLASLQDMSRHISATGQVVNKTMEGTQVVIQNATQQVMPEMVSVLHRIDGLARQMQGLVQELQHNPSMLVRGRQPIEPGPGEGR
jgi:phospholipid/cholesterol/gamma-HCH transport system substrate-binding protein